MLVFGRTSYSRSGADQYDSHNIHYGTRRLFGRCCECSSSTPQFGDRLLADVAFGDLDDVLMGYLAQLRNEAAVDGRDRSSAWVSALSFVKDILGFGDLEGSPLSESETAQRLLRLESWTRILEVSSIARSEIRALPPLVVEDLYDIFNPTSARNPFKTEKLRWRNLLIFLLLLRLGLRRGESGLLRVNSIKEDFDPGKPGQVRTWIDIDDVKDFDPRHEAPSLKTVSSARQLPISKDLVQLAYSYVANFRGRAPYPQLLTSQQDRPLSLRAISQIFETATAALSPSACASLDRQGLSGWPASFVS